jgi:hypothetical protein
MATFEKNSINLNYDHQQEVRQMFAELGFNDLKIQTSYTNGVSHYVSVNDFDVVNEMKLYGCMFVYEGETFITVRVSDHTSNLDTICGGVDDNRMNMDAFKKLIETGAIAPKQA